MGNTRQNGQSCVGEKMAFVVFVREWTGSQVRVRLPRNVCGTIPNVFIEKKAVKY